MKSRFLDARTTTTHTPMANTQASDLRLSWLHSFRCFDVATAVFCLLFAVYRFSFGRCIILITAIVSCHSEQCIHSVLLLRFLQLYGVLAHIHHDSCLWDIRQIVATSYTTSLAHDYFPFDRIALCSVAIVDVMDFFSSDNKESFASNLRVAMLNVSHQHAYNT